LQVIVTLAAVTRPPLPRYLVGLGPVVVRPHPAVARRLIV
jgi:hypothetical protein